MSLLCHLLVHLSDRKLLGHRLKKNPKQLCFMFAFSPVRKSRYRGLLRHLLLLQSDRSSPPIGLEVARELREEESRGSGSHIRGLLAIRLLDPSH
ncbi:hypothetical protein MA16_Dca008835 [Dendrobium catenatum]|uniref:Uncharacterized protein n=1 Tax=Dendrobium catenatum TaxID=906689 RepID=A0A2I0VUF3_9ASPA|nr:hypothetical protein MA16_Dca008835 [Dendrobium catenatum]